MIIVIIKLILNYYYYHYYYCYLYRLTNIVRVIKSRRLRWAGHVTKILTGKPTGMRPLGRPRRRWEDNIRMVLEEIGINGLIWLKIGIIGEPL